MFDSFLLPLKVLKFSFFLWLCGYLRHCLPTLCPVWIRCFHVLSVPSSSRVTLLFVMCIVSVLFACYYFWCRFIIVVPPGNLQAFICVLKSWKMVMVNYLNKMLSRGVAQTLCQISPQFRVISWCITFPEFSISIAMLLKGSKGRHKNHFWKNGKNSVTSKYLQ